MCHVIGFYLKHAHGFDLLKMKVDFNQDEFGEIWLMNVDNLFVRKSRNVPQDNGTLLADYVLCRMQDMKKVQTAKKRASNNLILRSQAKQNSEDEEVDERF